MLERLPSPLVAGICLLAGCCHAARPAAPPVPSGVPRTARPVPAAAASPSPAPKADIDPGPVEPWYRANAGRFVLDAAATAEDTAFTVNLLDWVAKGDPAAWERMAPAVERAYAAPASRLRLALARPDPDLARQYHEAAAPLASRPQAERDPEAEDRLYRKALLLNPADADLHNHLAIDASLRKDFPGAERWAKLAIAIDPDFIAAFQELAYAYKNLERYREAIVVADRGLQVDGDLHTKALLLARKGQAHWMLREEAEATSAFQGSRRLGGPAWVESYLEGKQEIGKPFREDPAAAR